VTELVASFATRSLTLCCLARTKLSLDASLSRLLCVGCCASGAGLSLRASIGASCEWLTTVPACCCDPLVRLNAFQSELFDDVDVDARLGESEGVVVQLVVGCVIPATMDIGALDCSQRGSDERVVALELVGVDGGCLKAGKLRVNDFGLAAEQRVGDYGRLAFWRSRRDSR